MFLVIGKWIDFLFFWLKFVFYFLDISICEIGGFFLNYRLYWLDIIIFKSVLINGIDIKSYIIISGVIEIFVYKVWYYFINIFEYN